MIPTRKNKSVSKYNLKCLYYLALLMSIFLTEVNGQFFSKSSSKSIPRMGRRSSQQIVGDAPDGRVEYPPTSSSLVDALIDEYGPELIKMFEGARLQANSMSADPSETPIKGRPIGLFKRDHLTNEQPISSDNSSDDPFEVDERSSSSSALGLRQTVDIF